MAKWNADDAENADFRGSILLSYYRHGAELALPDGKPHPKSQIPNPKSQTPNPKYIIKRVLGHIANCQPPTANRQLDLWNSELPWKTFGTPLEIHPLVSTADL